MDRLNNWRLPRALRLKERVDRGEKLTDYDLTFLKKIVEDGRHAASMGGNHPELESLISKLTDLYSHITRKALENEQKT